MLRLLVKILLCITLSASEIFAQNGPYFSQTDPYSSSLYAPSFTIPPPGALASGEQYAYTEVKTPLYHYYFFSPVLKPARSHQPDIFVPKTEQNVPVIDYKSGFGFQNPHDRPMFTPINVNEDGNVVRIPSMSVLNMSSPPTRRPPITSLYSKNKPLFQPSSTPLYSTSNVIRSEASVYSTQTPRKAAYAPSYKVYVLKKRPLIKPEEIPEVMAAPPSNIVREDDEEENLPPTFAKEKSSTESSTSFGTFPTVADSLKGFTKLNEYPTVSPPVFQRGPIVPANLLPSDPVFDLASSDPSLSPNNYPATSNLDDNSAKETTNGENPSEVSVYSTPNLRPYPTVSTEVGVSSSTTPSPPPAMLLPSSSVSDLSSSDPSRSIFTFPKLASLPKVNSVKSQSNPEAVPKENSKSIEQTFSDKSKVRFEAPGHNIPS